MSFTDTAMTWPGQPRCRFCGAAMTPLEAASRNNTCRAPACDRRRTREASEAILQREWDDHREKARERIAEAAPAIAQAARTLDRAPTDVTIAVLPHNSAPNVPRGEDERAALLAHIDRIVDEAFADDAPLAGITRTERARLERPERRSPRRHAPPARGSAAETARPITPT